MSDLVVDSCVVFKWIVPEADSAQAIRILSEVQTSGLRLILLDFAFPEVTNALWKRHHRGLMTAAETEASYAALMGIPCVIEPAIPHLRTALEIARTHQRSAYDARFVALAEGLGVDGVTADEPLYNAVPGDFPSIRLLRDR